MESLPRLATRPATVEPTSPKLSSAQSTAELNREEEARRRVDEERLRIAARELHDVTAHSLSIVAVQSRVVLHVLDTDPAAARKALEAIRRTSKDALDELRAMLGVLRRPGDPDAPLAPVPGLGRIADLVGPSELTPVTTSGSTSLTTSTTFQQWSTSRRTGSSRRR